MKCYTKKAIDNYALYNVVKLIDINNIAYVGWLVPYESDYMLLPYNTMWNTYKFKRSHIKEIYHMTNNVLIPKTFEGN